MELLWKLQSPVCAGRNVSCMDWNLAQPDVVAVGYGEFRFERQGQPGLVLVWSVKNPTHPLRTYWMECGATSLAFATRSPNLLAVGLYDGTLAIFDVRKEDSVPVQASAYSGGKHSDCIWEVVWTDKGGDRTSAEALVTVSADGRVTQWTLSKGLDYTDLIRLKRPAAASTAAAAHRRPGTAGAPAGPGGGLPGAPAAGSAAGGGALPPGRGEAFISRMAGGMCADFSKRDATSYIVGTEEGVVHRCSVAYNEQASAPRHPRKSLRNPKALRNPRKALGSFLGHSGPVYRVQWSPYHPSAFLSCGADWSIRLWHVDQPLAALTMQASDFVGDIRWSPGSSTVFASATGDGQVCLWDVAVSTLDPVISESILPGRPSCLRFVPGRGDRLIVGDDAGRVSFYRVQYPHPATAVAVSGPGAATSSVTAGARLHDDQLARLERVLAAKDSADT